MVIIGLGGFNNSVLRLPQMKITEFKVGDKVMVGVDDPKYNWGNVKPYEVGVICIVCRDGDYKVNFPSQKNWNAAFADLILVDRIKTFRMLIKRSFYE